ncbi:hypothetical protein PQX77_021590 [Marasmius sp. AFHP31]|nr:hypothetical protein PQX77_021590 [Marasmius sp. AFHP31]
MVIDRKKHGILAHLPSTLPPKWFCVSRNPDVKANYSGSGRVDLAFQKTGDVHIVLDVGWRIPGKDQSQLCCAFLCQSIHLYNDSADVEDLVYINQVGFRLKGTFSNHLTNCSMPAYLFVCPLPIKFINNAHCVYYPFPKNLFYWSHNQQGRDSIAEEDWERFGIPKLTVQDWIGSYWPKKYYTIVSDHLCSSSYNLDGRQYACDHGYPELIFADPHETTRIEELKDSESQPETSLAPLQLASSSTPSPMDVPLILECNNTAILPMASIVPYWARPGFLKKFYDSASETLTHVDDLDYSVAAC